MIKNILQSTDFDGVYQFLRQDAGASTRDSIKAYCRQMNKGQEEDGKYSNLKEIIFIAIAGCVLFPEKAEYISRHVILDKETNERDLKDFSFTFIELPKFKKTKVEELETITEKWCYFFKYAAKTEKEDLEKIIKGDSVI